MDKESNYYTVRGVPSNVDRVLRERAAKYGISLNQLIINELTYSTIGAKPRADFSSFAGRWSSDEAFDTAIEAGRTVNPEEWI